MGRRLSVGEIETMHALKTGALIHACVMMAAACAPALTEAQREGLDAYARAVGLAFQIQDDLLDIEGDPQMLGKAVGADQALNKPTYPLIAGIDAARARMHELHQRALSSLQVPGLQGDLLVAMSNWLVLRKH
jgi:geranylgeranyl diphosphate synthase type II